ncbi:MAG: formate dehydrogenase subunit gamma [Kiloniellales bacterium]|nr:formate dehydrogenase subunit gamma [Kiloniellales bacterium]
MIRHGHQGSVAGVKPPNEQVGVLIQSQGEEWRAFRNGPLARYGAVGLLGMVVVLALFFAIRGRIKIESGPAGVVIERFNIIERFGHWLTAISFIVLALTGLNILYGREVLMPILGKDIFATLTMLGKYAHNFIAFAFMAGLAMIFVMWVRHNIPTLIDLKWLLQGGGLFSKGSHPPSKKFNAGQKLIFWATILGGLSLSLSGWALLDPFQYSFFSDTFAVLNTIGFNLPTDLTPMQEQQLAQLWHGAVSLVLIAIIFAHIYIGSIGMEGAFAAMGTGKVDLNWAKEHHNLWVKEVEEEQVSSAKGTPAE